MTTKKLVVDIKKIKRKESKCTTKNHQTRNEDSMTERNYRSHKTKFLNDNSKSLPINN